MHLPLAGRLRDETRTLHTQVERSVFMATLLAGRLSLSHYCLLLRNLAPMYCALEAGLSQHAGHRAIAPVYFPALFRSAALQRDLEALHGPAWPANLLLLPAAAAYARHLQALAERDPALLAAHAYVRYLGDLSGGQLLQRLVARSMPPQLAGKGVDFYDFGTPAEVAQWVGRFRGGLETLACDGGQSDALVAQTRLAYEMHGGLFGELADACGLRPTAANAL